MKAYMTRSYYWHDYFVTLEYARVEYYRHLEIDTDVLTQEDQRFIERHGFTVVARKGSYYNNIGVLDTLWFGSELTPAKEVPSGD